MQTHYPRRYSSESRDKQTGEKVVAYVGSCAPCRFQTVKTSKAARDRALDEHIQPEN